MMVMPTHLYCQTVNCQSEFKWKKIDEVSEGGSTPIYYPHVCDTEPPRMLLNSENNSLFHLYPFLSSLPFIFSLLLYGINVLSTSNYTWFCGLGCVLILYICCTWTKSNRTAENKPIPLSHSTLGHDSWGHDLSVYNPSLVPTTLLVWVYWTQNMSYKDGRLCM